MKSAASSVQEAVVPAAHDGPATVFGPGAIDALPGEVVRLVGERRLEPRALVVLSRGSRARPWRDPILAELRVLDAEPWEPPAADATPAAVAAMVAAAREADAGVVVAIGGGAVMDTAKAGAAALRAERGGNRAPAIVAVPTTPGTGAEVTPFATVWDRAGGRKRSIANCAPDLAVVDPDLSRSLSRPDLAAAALDTLTHGAEAAWSTRATPDSIAAGLSAVALMSGAAGALLNGSQDDSHVCAASLAGLYGGRAIAVSETTVCHAVSYPLTLGCGLCHGHACGLTLGALLDYNAATPPDECLDMRGADHVRAVTRRIVRALGAPTPEAARDRIDAIRALGGLAPYPAIGADSAAVAAEALTYARAANNPRLLGSERLHALLASLEQPMGEP